MAAWQVDQAILDESLNVHGADVVHILRSSLLNRPWTLLKAGRNALVSHGIKRREYWDIASDMCRAAAECGEQTTAARILDRIAKKFPESFRCSVLRGVTLESQGRLGQAMDLYIHTISDNPMTPTAYKRQIAVFKSQSKPSEAVALLHHYLSIYSQDIEAWTEACALSMKLGRLSHALYAASELVVIDAANYAHHILLADVYMTCKRTFQNVTMAQVHYIASVNNHKRPNLRALYGIWLTTKLLLTAHVNQLDTSKRLDVIKLQKHTQRAIHAVYNSGYCLKQNSLHVDAMFEQIQIDHSVNRD